MQIAYQLHCTAAAHPILLLHPISHQSCVHLPVKASKSQVGLAHKQDNRSMIQWSRTTCLRHLKVQGPAKGKHGLDISQCLECLTEPHCSCVHTTGEAQPGQLEKEEGGAAIPSTASVCTGANTCTALCPWGFVAGSVYCLYSVQVCTQVLFYIVTSLMTQESQQPGLLWLGRGKKKSPHPKIQGILLP